MHGLVRRQLHDQRPPRLDRVEGDDERGQAIRLLERDSPAVFGELTLIAR